MLKTSITRLGLLGTVSVLLVAPVVASGASVTGVAVPHSSATATIAYKAGMAHNFMHNGMNKEQFVAAHRGSNLKKRKS